MRKSLVICLALLTAACERDQLHSNHPLLSERSAVLRDGVWLYIDDDCPVDVRASPRQWPDCAHWSVIRKDWESEQTGALEGTPRHWMPLVLRAGDPGLLQMGRSGKYSYELMQPIASDSAGWLVEVRRWPVLCSDYVVGGLAKKREDPVSDDAPGEASPPLADLSSDAPDEVDDSHPPPLSLPGAYRIDDLCYTDTLDTLAVAQYSATRDDRFPGNFRWVRETVR